MEQLVFAHISDLHFGDVRVSAKKGGVPGQSGHDLLLCQALPDALDHLRERTDMPPGVQFPVVMSGDLTRTGRDPAEFEVGTEYLKKNWTAPLGLPNRRFGLALGPDKVLMIPGNHDHWDGNTKYMWGYNAAIMGVHFRQTPFLRRLYRPRRKGTHKGYQLILEFFGVDSCSGFPPIGAGQNRRARGRIADTELKTLSASLRASDACQAADAKNRRRRVRVLVCHHSLQGNWLLGWFFGSLELDGKSANTLRYLAGRYSVAALLTGHTHDFLADRYDLSFNRRLREFRSATTLQGPARYFKQGFFGHRVRVDGRGRVWWTTYPYQWQGSYFYPLPVEESVPPAGNWNPFFFEVT